MATVSILFTCRVGVQHTSNSMVQYMTAQTELLQPLFNQSMAVDMDTRLCSTATPLSMPLKSASNTTATMLTSSSDAAWTRQEINKWYQCHVVKLWCFFFYHKNTSTSASAASPSVARQFPFHLSAYHFIIITYTRDYWEPVGIYCSPYPMRAAGSSASVLRDIITTNAWALPE